jgi:hypothetical protein
MPATAAKKMSSAISSLSLGGFLWAPGISGQRLVFVRGLGEPRETRTSGVDLPLLGFAWLPSPGTWLMASAHARK